MRTLLVFLIIIVSFCSASFLIFRDWQSLPPRNEQKRPLIDALVEKYQPEAIQELANTLQAGQGSLLSQDNAILQLPDPVGASAKQLKHTFSTTLTIEQQLSLIPAVSEKIKNIIVHTPDLLDSLHAQPNMQDFLINNPNNEVKEGIAAAIKMFGDLPDSEIIDATIRRSIALAIVGEINAAFTMGKYRECVDLCNKAIRQLDDAPMQDAVRQIEIYRLRSLERQGWNIIRHTLLQANDAILSSAELAALQNYVTEFADPKFELILPFHGSRLAQTRRVLNWQQLLRKHELEDAFARKPVSWVTEDTKSISIPILDLNEFHKKHPDTPEAARAKEIATALLIQRFENALKPLLENQKHVELVLRRTGAKHEGIIDTDTEHRTTLKPEFKLPFFLKYEPKENQQSHFFTAAIHDEPRVVDNFLQEEQYREQFRTVQAAVTQDTWSPIIYANFLNSLTGTQLKRAERKAALEEISRLIAKCNAFSAQNIAQPIENNK